MNEPDTPRAVLKRLGKQVLDTMRAGEFPLFEIPDRKTSNIIYDASTKRYTLGPSKIKRDARNAKHIRSLTQLVWAASFAKQLLDSSRSSSLRDLYYSSEAFGIDFADQAESDRIVTDLECLTGLARESFGVFPEEHSSIYGDVLMRYTVPGYEGKEIDLTISPDGLPVGPALVSAEPVRSNASAVLAVESGGMFSRLIETRAWERYRLVLVHLGGQPPRGTRRIIRTLRQELDLPVHIFTDGDPWGMHIARVIISGSANAAHIKDLTVPDAKWIGVTPADIENYALPNEPLNNADLKRLDDLTRDVRYQNAAWKHHIDGFRRVRKKAEQQAFSRYGMDFVVDEYLSEKLA
jgi:DNA topoisomerase-6 subunit A